LVAQAHWLSEEGQAQRLEIIKTVNTNAHSTWKAGVNPRFDGTTLEYVKSLCGSLEDKGQHNLEIRDPTPVAAPPDAFDSRTQWGSMCPSVNEIRDQSNCGSCWAFGAAEAATDRYCIETSGAKKQHFSAEDVLSCCKTCGSGCNGGYPSSAWQWIVSTGVVSGGNYNDFSLCVAYELQTCDHHTTGQYVPCTSLPTYQTPPCQLHCDDNTTYSTSYSADKSKFATSYGVSSVVANIQTEIMTNGPVEASFSVYADFESYVSGVYVHTTGSYLGGHAVKIIGWGTDGSTPYWTVANSWNTDWGEKGFFRIIRGVNECGIEGSIVAGKVSK
jgi:cathepsin B